MRYVVHTAHVDGARRYLLFYCPGCKRRHQVMIGVPEGWGYNEDPARPTFTPSVKVRWPANPDAAEEFKEWRSERICHSYVTDGRIQFLDDCTHDLRGQTVDLPPWED